MSNKSVDIEILLRETIVEGVKKAKEAIKDLDAGSKDSTKNFKEQIAQQKQYIKELAAEIKKLEEAREGTTGSKRSNINVELGQMRHTLNAENAILQDMQKKNIDLNKDEEKSQGGLVSSLGKWAIGLASVTAALQIGKSIIESTKDTADKFEFAVSAAQGGLEQLWRTIATGDFSNFFDNMGRAIKAGYDFAEAMDKVKESTWALQMDEADVKLKKYQLLEDIRNRELPKDQRIAKGEEYITLEEGLAKKRTDNANLELDAFKKRAATISGIQEDEIVNTLKQVNQTTRIKAEAYNEDLERVKSLKNQALLTSAPEENFRLTRQAQELNEELKKAPEEVKTYANALRGVGKLKEEFIVGFVEAYKKVGDAAASGQEGSLRARNTLHSLKAEIKKDGEDAAKKAKEDAELDNRIKATQELMRAASGDRLSQLAEEYVALSKLKAANNELIDQAIKLARNPDGTVAPALMKARGKAVTSNATPPVAGLQASTWTDIPLARSKNEYTEEELKTLEKQKKLRREILDAVMSLTYQLAQQVGMSEEDAKVVGGLMETTMKAASGDYVGAALATLSTVIALIPTHAQKFQAQIKEINALLEQQQRLISQSSRLGGESAARQAEIRTLEEKKKALEAEQQRLENKKGFLGLFTGKKKLAEVNDELAKLELQIEDANTALTDFFSGGVTQSTLADSIAQSFQDGKGSVDDFGSYTNKILQDAVLSAFKANILGDTLTNAQEQIAEAFKDKTLTAEEIAAIRSTMQSATDEAKAKWDALTQAFPEMYSDTASGSTGMTANIKAITEETASALGGNISAIRINMARLIESGNTSMSMLQQSLEYQLRTADNTEEMGKTLLQIDNRLSRIELDGLKVK